MGLLNAFVRRKRARLTCVTSDDLDQPVHPHSLLNHSRSHESSVVLGMAALEHRLI